MKKLLLLSFLIATISPSSLLPIEGTTIVEIKHNIDTSKERRALENIFTSDQMNNLSIKLVGAGVVIASLIPWGYGFIKSIQQWKEKETEAIKKERVQNRILRRAGMLGIIAGLMTIGCSTSICEFLGWNNNPTK